MAESSVRLFDFLKPAVPLVPVGPTDREAIEARVQDMSTAELPALVLKQVVEQDLFDLSTAFRGALRVPDEELACELYIQAFIGFLSAADHLGMDLDAATDRLEPHHAALREYVAFGHRERYDQGPLGTWTLSRKMAGERDPTHVALGMAAVRLGVTRRRGAVEGMMRLGMLAQLAGYGLGEISCS